MTNQPEEAKRYVPSEPVYDHGRNIARVPLTIGVHLVDIGEKNTRGDKLFYQYIYRSDLTFVIYLRGKDALTGQMIRQDRPVAEGRLVEWQRESNEPFFHSGGIIDPHDS